MLSSEVVPDSMVEDFIFSLDAASFKNLCDNCFLNCVDALDNIQCQISSSDYQSLLCLLRVFQYFLEHKL